MTLLWIFFFFSSRRRHTRFDCDWSSDVCSSDLGEWLGILRSLGLADDKLSMHRKPYEFTQLIYGCRKLGALREEASVVSRSEERRVGKECRSRWATYQ